MVDTDILKNKKLMDGIDGYLSDMERIISNGQGMKYWLLGWC